MSFGAQPAITPAASGDLEIPAQLVGFAPIHTYTEAGVSLWREESTGIHALIRDPHNIEFGGKNRGLRELTVLRKPVPKALLISADVNSTDEAEILTLVPVLRHAAKVAGISNLAVFRSSSPYEDGEHTGAGLFHSEFQFLAAPDAALARSISLVTSSAVSPDALTFCLKHGLSVKPLGLVIQEMVFNTRIAEELKHFRPDMAGIIDSSHPDYIEVSLAYCLGTAAVSGVTPLFVRFSRDNGAFIEESSIPVKTWQYISQRDDGSARLKSHYDRHGEAGVRLPESFRQLIAADVRDIERSGRGQSVELEFAIANEAMWYVQKRPVRPLVRDFHLPECEAHFEVMREIPVLETTKPGFGTPGLPAFHCFAPSYSVVGQGVASSPHVFLFRPPNRLLDILSGAYRIRAQAETERLITYNETHSDGYILMIDAPMVVGGTDVFSSRECLPYRAFSNARAIVGVDSSRYEWRQSRRGLCHFSQYVRSEEVPFVVVRWQDLERLPKIDELRIEKSMTLPEGMELRVGANQFGEHGYVGVPK